MIKAGLSNKYKVDPYGTEEIISSAANSCAPILTIDYGDEVQTDAEFTVRPTKGSLDTNISDVAIVGPIKGNTVAWNQYISDCGVNNTLATQDTSITTEKKYIINQTVISSTRIIYSISADNVFIPESHKALVVASYKSDYENGWYLRYQKGISGQYGSINDVFYTKNAWCRLKAIVDNGFTAGTNSGFLPIAGSYVEGTYLSIPNEGPCIQAIDLTLIYGPGNEPTTVEAFEADYYKWFGKQFTYEPYSAGELRPVRMSYLKSVGFNQWDEEWEVGGLYRNTINSKNYIKVIGGAAYYCNNNICVWYYDANKNQIETDVLKYPSAPFVVPDGVEYMKFRTILAYGTTYNHDICINISNLAKNGQYEAYKPNFCNIPVTTLKGKLNGEGNSVVVFADGMKSAGNARDEIKIENRVAKAIKRVGTRAYESGDVNSSTMTTDGANYTNYALTTPEEYIIDDVSVEKVMLGSTEVTKVYLGNQLIFESN